MHPDTPPSDRPARLRLVDLRVRPGRQLHLGGSLAGVLTETRDRSAAANWIAATVAGPRPPETDGSIDLGGEIVSVHSLPSPMLAPGLPKVIDGDLLRSLWRTSRARRRDVLAATHASYRLERYRIEAALERARARRVPLPREVAAGPEPEEVAAPDPEAVAEADVAPVEREYAGDEYAPLRAQVESLIAELDTLPAAPLPEGGLLADAWDAHSLLVEVRDAVDDLPASDIERLEQRVDDARAALAMTSSGVSDDMRALIEQCHLGVLEAEAAVLSAKRRERSRAAAGYEQAVAVELMALADAGIESYAAFVVAIDEETSAANAAARRAAQAELVLARAELDALLGVPDMPTRVELEERETQMRSRATELLGRAPGPDPVGELRALRVPTEDRDELLDEISAALREREIVVVGDLVEFARSFVAPAQPRDAAAGEPAARVASVRPSEPRRPAAPARPVPQRTATIASRAVDVETLEQQRFAHDRALEQLDTDLAAIDAVYNAPLSALGAADVNHAVEVMLDLYRKGQLLGGRLPVVLDGALDGLAASAREAAVEVLLEADDLQTIVVSDDAEVMQSLARAGGTIVRWPEAEPGERDASMLQPTPTRGA